jgi:hypothetical protein
MSRDSSVDIAIRYGLDGPVIECRWGCGLYHPPPSSGEVKGGLKPYVFSTSGPSWPVLG